jgi:hypothetical protein
MSYTEAVTRVTQIQSELAALKTGVSSPSQAPPTSFAQTLAAAQAAGTSVPGASPELAAGAVPAGMPAASSGVPATGLSPSAQGMLTSGQQQFAARLAQDTGLNPQVIGAWLLAEESGGAAQSRQSANNNDWLNIGYTDSGTYGSSDSVWSEPLRAADATAGWLKGQNTIPGYGTASSGVQAILGTAGQAPQAQIAAIQGSGWASSGYPDLPSLYQQVAA